MPRKPLLLLFLLAAPLWARDNPSAWVQVRSAVIELELQSATKKLALYSNDYTAIDFRAGNFTPKGELHVCDELQGMKARVTYFATADKSTDGQIVSIMMFR